MEDHSHPILKILTTWLLVGVSQMTPLQWAQFLAAMLAIVYTALQIWLLLFGKDKK